MSPRLRLLVVLARPAALLLFALCTALGLAEAGQAENHVLLIESLVAVFAFVLCSVAVNDVADERIDRVNLPGDIRRPLVAGTASRDELAMIAAGAAVVALGVSAWLGLAPFVITAIGLVVSIGYSLPPVRIADRGAVAALVLPGCYVGVPFLVGFSAAGAPFDPVVELTLGGLYLGFIGRLLLKDFRDVRGDELFGKRTFLVRRGRAWTCAASALAWTAGTVLLALGGPGIACDVITVALTAATLALLAVLARDGGPRRDERIIAAIAILGRGLLQDLLANLGLQQAHWSPLTIAAILLLLTAVAGGAAGTMLRSGPSGRIVLCTGRGSRVSSDVRTLANQP
jgi:4-hydroxybenzoate polyprenyltransferase